MRHDLFVLENFYKFDRKIVRAPSTSFKVINSRLESCVGETEVNKSQVSTMKRKESTAIFHPSRFHQATLQVFVIFSLFGIVFSEGNPKAKEATSEVTTSTMPAAMAIPIQIPINKDKFSGKYISSVPNPDSIDFVFYPPDQERCFADDQTQKYSVIFTLPGYGSLVIEWSSVDSDRKIKVYSGMEIKQNLKDEENVRRTFNTGVNTILMSIPRRKGDANQIAFTPEGDGKAKFQCVADIYDPFELSHSGIDVKDGCELKIELLNAYEYTTTTSTTHSTTTTSATMKPGSITSSAASSSALTTTTQNTIGISPLTFGLTVGGIVLLLVLLVAGLLLYFLWWRKRKTNEEEENEPSRTPGKNPESSAKSASTSAHESSKTDSKQE